MPRRAVLTEAQRAVLLALPNAEADLVRYWTLSADDRRIIVSRRRLHNRLGFAIQLCALRYPGRMLQPGEVRGGVSDHVFALCHLLGFQFAPRIPNLSARRLYLFDGPKPGPDIAPLVAGKIDEHLIAAHWDDVIRLAVSIRTGVVSASTMLERLGSYPRANGLALALREIGRVERTLFTLDWIENPEERRHATRELNKGEAENALHRAIFFHRTGRLRDHGIQAQSHRASALNLVAGAIVLWNTTYLEAATRHLHQQGRPIGPDMLQHLSPLGWQHINLERFALRVNRQGIPESAAF